jgi:hypothetical protein
MLRLVRFKPILFAIVKTKPKFVEHFYIFASVLLNTQQETNKEIENLGRNIGI